MLVALLAPVPASQAANPYESCFQWHAGTSYYRYTYEDPTAEQGVYQLAMAGNKLVVADLFWGFFAFEVLSPGNLETGGNLEFLDNCRALATDASYSYVSSYGDVYVVDIGDVHTPSIAATIDGLDANDLQRNGDYLYSAGADFRVYDVSDPTNPQLAGSLALPGTSVAILGNRAYVIDDTALWTVDISNPANPALVGSSYSSSYLADLEITNGVLLAADFSSGLRVFSLADPDAPVLLTTVPEAAGYSFAAGDGAAIVSSSPTVYIDLSDPSAPVTGAELRGTSARDGVIADGFAYLAADYQGVQVFEIGNGTNPEPAASFGEWPDATQVAAFPNYLALLIGGTLEIVDVSDPLSPLSVGSVEVPSGARLDVDGSYAYVVGGSPGLRVVDLATPSTPTIVGSLTGIRGSSIDATEGRLYCADNTRMLVVDVSVPSTPTLLADHRGFDFFIDIVAASGPIAYTAENFEGNGILYEIDYTDPGGPVFTNTAWTGDTVYELALAGDRLYVSTQRDLYGTQRSVLYPEDRLGDHLFGSSAIVPGSQGRLYGITSGQFYALVDDGTLSYALMGSPPGGGAQALDEAQGMLFVASDSGLHVYELPSATSSAQPVGSRERISLQIAPNPTGGETHFVWNLSDAPAAEGAARVDIFGPGGRHVRTLVEGVEAGHATWDGRDEGGILVSAGVFFVRLTTQAGESRRTIRVLR